MNEHNDSLLVAEYVLGLLDQIESNAFEKRLLKEPELRSAFLRWAEHFSTLYDDVEDVIPPAKLKANIHDRLFGEPKADRVRAKPKSSIWLWHVNLVSSLVLASLIGLIYHQSQKIPFQADFTANLEAKDKSLQVVARYDEARKLLHVSSIKATPATGRSHELWLIAGGNPPVSLGTLNTINNEKIVLPDELSELIIGSTLAISDEPIGGSPTGSPTGAVLSTAIVVKI